MPYYCLSHSRLHKVPHIHSCSWAGAREQWVCCILLLTNTQGPVKAFLYLGLILSAAVTNATNNKTYCTDPSTRNVFKLAVELRALSAPVDEEDK
jgi:hypothetical protein